MTEEEKKPRKPRSDKGAKRESRHVPLMAPERPQITVDVDGEQIFCDSYQIEGGFLKLRYWAAGRGRVGTRLIRLEAVRDVSIEEPQQMSQPMSLSSVSVAPAQVTAASRAWIPLVNPTTPNLTTTLTPAGPIEEVNPLIAMRRRDPKANMGQRVADPIGMRPMSKIVDENGNVSVVEAGMQ